MWASFGGDWSPYSFYRSPSYMRSVFESETWSLLSSKLSISWSNLFVSSSISSFQSSLSFQSSPSLSSSITTSSSSFFSSSIGFSGSPLLALPKELDPLLRNYAHCYWCAIASCLTLSHIISWFGSSKAWAICKSRASIALASSIERAIKSSREVLSYFSISLLNSFTQMSEKVDPLRDFMMCFTSLHDLTIKLYGSIYPEGRIMPCSLSFFSLFDGEVESSLYIEAIF